MPSDMPKKPGFRRSIDDLIADSHGGYRIPPTPEEHMEKVAAEKAEEARQFSAWAAKYNAELALKQTVEGPRTVATYDTAEETPHVLDDRRVITRAEATAMMLDEREQETMGHADKVNPSHPAYGYLFDVDKYLKEYEDRYKVL